MSRQNTYRHVAKIEEATRIILSYVENLDYESFKKDLKTQDAVMMRLVSIGERVNRLIDNDPDFINDTRQIPWNMIRGMRNKIAHDYFGIDSRVLFETARTSIPQLAEMMYELKSSIPPDVAGS
jgi:uncharacterized protein with HEPN domain